jgi:hypothetical protein
MPIWVRVRDPDTGHVFDWPQGAAEAAIERGEVERAEHEPPHVGDNAHPRPAKHHVGLDGNPRTRRTQPQREPGGQPANIGEKS